MSRWHLRVFLEDGTYKTPESKLRATVGMCRVVPKHYSKLTGDAIHNMICDSLTDTEDEMGGTVRRAKRCAAPIV